MTNHTFMQGDVLTALAVLPDSSIHCVVTSPPYFDQRNYGVEGQGGLQSTPSEYLAWLVTVSHQIRSVLRDDGTYWLNIGDGQAKRKYTDPLFGTIKKGDLLGIPWMLALLLRKDGWTLKSSNIWAKTNPKPTFAKTAPAAGHEYILQFTKIPTGYYYDSEAVKEPLKHPNAQGQLFGGKKFPGNVPNSTYSGKVYDPSQLTGRNRGSVWSFSTASYSGKHTAVFPETLPKICINAGTSEYGCCPTCGAPYRRIVATGEPDLAWQRACGGDKQGSYTGKGKKDYAGAKAEDASSIKARILKSMCRKKTVGWEPTCTCSISPPIPCTVLDPFSGSGTTALVARKLGRSSIGIELNPDSIDETRERLGIASQATLDTGSIEYEFLVVE